MNWPSPVLTLLVIANSRRLSVNAVARGIDAGISPAPITIFVKIKACLLALASAIIFVPAIVVMTAGYFAM